MATIDAKVTQIGDYTISTNKGDFTGRVLYLDCPIENNNYYNVTKTSDNRNIYPYETSLSVFKSVRSGSTANTPFLSDNELISYGYLSGDLKLYIKDTTGNVLNYSSVDVSSQPTAIMLGFLFIGTNNVVILPDMYVYNYTNNSGVTYSINTVDNFGSFEWISPTATYTISFPYNANKVKCGEIIYKSSSIYNYDPYGPGGESGPGGGGGDFNNENEPVDFPTLPQYSAIDSGLLTIYSPLIADIRAFANYLWSGLFDLDTFKKLFSDPMQAVITLGIVPLTVSTTTNADVYIGNMDSGLDMPKVDSQYVYFDCGSINISNYYGSYLDYEPYTKIEIFLPFIGFHQLSTDDLMGNTISLKYVIDLLTGSCIAMLKSGNHVLYTFSGNCMYQIPITSANWVGIFNGIVSAATSIGAAAVGVTAPPLAMGAVASTAINIAKPTIEKSGSVIGNAGLLGVKTPYLVITRPRQCVPKDQNRFLGYPSFINRKISTLEGYTEIEIVHLKNIPCTSEELIEIENLLKDGVIL